MAEKGTVVKDDSIGDVVATRDALEPDEGANPRVIELIDFASRLITWEEVRGDFSAPTPVSADDGVDLDTFVGLIYPTALTIGDKSTVVVQVWHTQNDGSVTLTPIFFNGFTYAPGESKITAMGSLAFTADPAGAVSTIFMSPLLSWDCLGAEKINFHISGLSASNGVYIQAGVI